ncbi:MAG: hypothetical protein JW997_04785 [Actinobacteria bacterium]|nr:hypothetical protein [Actinomycetota bacterium]
MQNKDKQSMPLSKIEVIKAIEKKNPSDIPGWYNWVADETWEKYGQKLKELMDYYTNDIVMVSYDMPEGFVEPAPERDEFHIYYVNEPGVFSGMRKSDLARSWEKLEKLMKNFPDPYAKGRFYNARDLRHKQQDAYIAGHWWALYFERMIALRGEEDFLTDIYLERQRLEKLGWMICDFFCGIVEGFAEAGMDGIFFSDDLGFSRSLVFKPEIFRQIFKPWYKKLFAKIKSHNMHVIMHSCGYIWEIIPDLIDCGLDVLHFQPSVLDSKRLVKEFGRDLTFFGGIDIQRFLPNSTPEELEKGIREIFGILDHDGGGYISGPSNSIMPDTPFENIERMLYSMKKYSDRKLIGHWYKQN